MTESELDRWAAIYRANPYLARTGVDFGDLLDDPALLFSTLPAPAEDGSRPLLPAQARIAERVRRDEKIADAVRARALNVAACMAHAERILPAAARHRGGSFIEPLSHHAYKFSPEICRSTRPLR